MSKSKPNLLPLIGLPVAAALLTFFLLFMAANVISGLPRPMQGENVSVPWSTCVRSAMTTVIALPWLASLRFLRQPRDLIYFLLCLICAAVAWYFLGMDHLLSKAYRRGL